MTVNVYEERPGSYRYVRIATDDDGTVRELATNSAGEGLFYRTVYKSGPTEWRQSKGTNQFSAKSLRDFQSSLEYRERGNAPKTGTLPPA